MKSELLALIFDISLKVRILRMWQVAKNPGTSRFDERQLLALEILAKYGEQTESFLASTLGLASSSTVELSKRLEESGAVRKKTPPKDKRTTVLELTSQGQEILNEIKKINIARFEYLFSGMTEDEVLPLENILTGVLKAAERRLAVDVFEMLPK